MTAPMSAEEVLAVLDGEIRALPTMAGLIRHGEHECDETPAIERLTNARTAVAAMAEREAALVEGMRRILDKRGNRQYDTAGEMLSRIEQIADEDRVTLRCAEANQAALVKEVEALREWRTLETPMMDILLMEGHDPYVVAAHGRIAGVIESVVEDLKNDPLPEFSQHGDGVYTVRAHYFSGQYGEYGRCEFPPCWELELISVDTAIDAARAEARDG